MRLKGYKTSRSKFVRITQHETYKEDNFVLNETYGRFNLKDT